MYENHLCALQLKNTVMNTTEQVVEIKGLKAFLQTQCTYMIFIYLKLLFTTCRVYLVERYNGIAEVMGSNLVRA